MEGLWRWEVDGNPLWLLQLLIIEGSGAFGQGAVLLLEGQRKAAGKVVNLSTAMEGLWEGQYGSSAQQTRLKPQLFFGRYLVAASVASRAIGVYDVKAGTKLALITDMPQADLLDDVLLSVDQRHVIQLNSDGQFFLHEIATGRMVLSGRYVDGEIILYTPEAYYWSSYEGAHFVQLRFPGLRGLYSFQQFAAVLNRPNVIKARLAGASAAELPRLVPPGGGSAADRGYGFRRRTPRRGAGTLRGRARACPALSGRPADQRPVRVRAAVTRARSRFRKRAMRAGSRRWPPTRAG